MIHPLPVARKLPIKILVVRQLPTNAHTHTLTHMHVRAHTHTHTHTHTPQYSGSLGNGLLPRSVLICHPVNSCDYTTTCVHKININDELCWLSKIYMLVTTIAMVFKYLRRCSTSKVSQCFNCNRSGLFG